MLHQLVLAALPAACIPEILLQEASMPRVVTQALDVGSQLHASVTVCGSSARDGRDAARDRCLPPTQAATPAGGEGGSGQTPPDAPLRSNTHLNPLRVPKASSHPPQALPALPPARLPHKLHHVSLGHVTQWTGWVF